MEIIETERLILRTFTQDDLDDFFEYASNENVGANAGWAPHTQRETSADILNGFINGNEVWAIELKQNGKLIGSIGLHKDTKRDSDDTRELGYALSEDYWGQGLMSEAAKSIIDYGFSKYKLNLISCSHFPFNKSSKRVIEKMGFQYEGTLRHAYRIYSGKVYDIITYSMTRDEWLEN